MENCRNILVIGAGGYIGSVLVPSLLYKDYKVVAVDRFFFGQYLPINHPNLTVIQEDCRKLEISHFKNIFAVIDLAAVSNDPTGEFYKKATLEINAGARIQNAKLAKEAGCARYILASSCSVYGAQKTGEIIDEQSKTNPLTTYARANVTAENALLQLSDSRFAGVALRQATIYGYSPRMRFDLAINNMTLQAWSQRRIPLMRDGSQWRPMLHVNDASNAQIFVLEAPHEIISGEVFNVGSEGNNYQIREIANLIIETVGSDVTVDWYGDPDKRSYNPSFAKIESIGFKVNKTATDGIREILHKLQKNELTFSEEMITLDWYQKLANWDERITAVKLHGGLVDLAHGNN